MPLDRREGTTILGRLAFESSASVNGNKELEAVISRGVGVIWPFGSIVKHLRIPVSRAGTSPCTGIHSTLMLLEVPSVKHDI